MIDNSLPDGPLEELELDSSVSSDPWSEPDSWIDDDDWTDEDTWDDGNLSEVLTLKFLGPRAVATA